MSWLLRIVTIFGFGAVLYGMYRIAAAPVDRAAPFAGLVNRGMTFVAAGLAIVVLVGVVSWWRRR